MVWTLLRESRELDMNSHLSYAQLEKRNKELEEQVLLLGDVAQMQFRSKGALAFQAAFARLITTISTRFINIDPNKIDSEIYNTLETIGGFAGVDRCYVFQMHKADKSLDNTHEWCAEGIASQIDRLKGLCQDDYPWQMEQLNRSQTIYIANIEDLPPEADPEKKLLMSQDIKSSIMVPMVTRQSLVGFIAFASVHYSKIWSNDAISLLTRVGEIIVNALERKRIEDALERSEEKIQRVIEQLRDDYFFYRHDTKGIFTHVSPSVTNVLGYSPEEFLTSYTTYLTDNPINKIAKKDTELSIKGIQQEPYEVEIYHKEGHTVVIEVQEVSIAYEQGKVVAVEGLAHNITRRKKAEVAILRENEELERRVKERTAELDEINTQLLVKIKQYEKAQQKITALLQEQDIILDSVPAIIFYKDTDHKLIRVNKAFSRLFDKDKQDLEGSYYCDIGLDHYNAEEFTREDEIIMSSGRAKRQTMSKFNINNISRWLLTDKIPYRDSTDKIIGIIGFALDISDYKNAEDRILTLNQKLIKAEELERLRISHYLHDTVAQNLSSARIDCSMFLGDYMEEFPELRRKFRHLSDILHKSIIEIRDLSYDLRPPHFVQMGLAHAIYRFCEEFSTKYGIDVDFLSAGIEDIDLNFDTEINLYRITQEALNNVRKHSEAGNVLVRLVASYPNIILRIEDDGKGFHMPFRFDVFLSKKSMGLQSMEERAHLIRGHFKIHSQINKGTQILVEAPYIMEERDNAGKENRPDN